MAALKNTKHEYFAQGLAKGKTATQAYIDAGYSKVGAQQASSRLLLNVVIMARVTELKERAAQKAVIDIVSATEGLMRIAGKAERLEDASGYQAARAAIMDAAKLNGLVVDKSQLDATVRSLALSESDKAAIAGLAKQVDNEY